MPHEPARADVWGAMRSLAVDGITTEVAAAMRAAGADVILLKGPVIAQWLYPDGDRTYGDTDLLVKPAHERRAERVLASLGFRADPGTGWDDPGIARHHQWVRGEAFVELHITLTGIEAPAEEVWEQLSAGAEVMSLRGETVRVLALPARLLHVALHAAQHGPEFGQALRDLERSCAAQGAEDWSATAVLATRLRATEALSAGLGLAPGGAEIKHELGLPDPSDPLVVLRARSASAVTLGVARFVAGSPRSRALQLWRVLLPTPTFLRWWTPLARHGRLGLLAAYAWRYTYLAGSLPGALRSFGRARRERAKSAAR